MSLSLLRLKTQIVTVMAVIEFDLARSRYGKSFGRCLMCLDFSHIIPIPFSTDRSEPTVYRTALSGQNFNKG